jgi:2-methylisocitrate lyase-like PEP mutase family enzyme
MHKLATAFRQLHEQSVPLVLANVWDVGSARLIESLGAPALATTSAGVAWSLGYPDGNRLPVDELVHLVSNMVRILRIPLSVDIEGGYTEDLAVIAEVTKRLLDAGAVGINIEDGSEAPEVLVAKIEVIKKTASAFGVDLFINARTDVFLRGLVPVGKRLGEAMARAARYRSAGADGLFVPAVFETDAIRALAAEVTMPLNVMAWPGLPPLKELAKQGVRRLSSGAAIPQILWARPQSSPRSF